MKAPSRKAISVYRRSTTAKRRANARLQGLCTVCFVNQASLALGRTAGTASTCTSCRDRKRAKRAAKP